jgi:hypothetical protein
MFSIHFDVLMSKILKKNTKESDVDNKMIKINMYYFCSF